MDKQLLPSIEKFAAYLDGNLSQDEMLQFSRLITKNENLMNFLDANADIEETLASYGEADLQLPHEVAERNFNLPQIENIENFTSIGDSFSENASLYNQENFHAVDKILDDVFDDKNSAMEMIDDMGLIEEHEVDTDVLDLFS